MKMFNKAAVVFLTVVFLFGLVRTSSAATQVNLGTAGKYAVLGGSTVTNTGSSIITGDLGLSPGLAVVGFPPGAVNGTIHAGDANALQAQNDLVTAYNEAAGQACDVDLSGQDLGGMTLTPGTYCFSSSAQLTGAVTLNAQGNSSAVFVFQMGSTLTTASNSSVNIINSGQACNVFWQIGTSATIGTTTDFKGNVLALTSITLNTNATVEDGRMLARNGAVTLDTNTISSATCSSGGSGSGGDSDNDDNDIRVKKEASDYTLRSGPKSITFKYKVTNRGDVPLGDISVKDDKCDDVDFDSGDDNDDEMLDTDEEWKYSCKKTVKKTETNTVTAKGTASGERLRDTDKVTVTVSTPGLPKAGVGPDDKNNTSWNVIILGGILVSLAVAGWARKKMAF